MRKLKTGLVFAVAILFGAWACNSSTTSTWINTALQDLPVIIQVASGIAGLVSTVQGGVGSSDAAIVADISKQAAADLTLVQQAYQQYKQNPNSTTLQAIQDAIGTVDANLPALLAAAHIENSKLKTEVTAAVDLVMTTVDAFAALVPGTPAPASMARRASRAPGPPPTPDQIKQRWSELSGGRPLE